MLSAEFLLQLPSGQLISYEEILSPFEIYTHTRKYESWFLIPIAEQPELAGVVIYANKNGIKILQRRHSFNGVVSKLQTTISCSERIFKKVLYSHIPSDILNTICEQLIKEIHYQ